MSSAQPTLIATLAAFVLALLLTPAVRRVATALNAVGRPDELRPQTLAVPRLGGLAIFAAVLGGLLAAERFTASGLAVLYDQNWPLAPLLAGVLIILTVGAVDDLRSLPPSTKLALQLLAALVAVGGGFGFAAVTNPFTGGVVELGWLGVLLSLGWIVAITNAFNLIDGLDGLAAGVGLIACVSIALIALVEGRPDAVLLALVLGAALLGFLFYNFHPASIFLGDCGSLLLGYSLALLSIRGLQKGTTLIVVLVPLLTLGLPIIDTSVTIVRRYLVAGWGAIFRGDQEHFHHRLMALGMTHRNAVLTLYAAGAGLGLLAFVAMFVNGVIKALLLALAAAVTWIAVRRLGYRG